MNVIYVIIIVIIALLLAFYIYTESVGFTVTEYRFQNSKLKCEEYDFVMLSDLHDKEFGENNCKLIEAIDAINPKAVVFAGDMITSGMELSYDFSGTVRFIKELGKKYPIYYGIGNHEEKLKRCPNKFPGRWSELTTSLELEGIRIMQNESAFIEDAGIRFYCLDLEHPYYRKIRTLSVPNGYIDGKLGKCNEDEISVLIAHFPDQFPAYADWGCDYVLSGHVHGGVVRIPFLGGVISPQLKIFPKYDSGLFREKSTTMILSRGIGSHTIPIRVNNKAEIVHVTLTRG